MAKQIVYGDDSRQGGIPDRHQDAAGSMGGLS